MASSGPPDRDSGIPADSVDRLLSQWAAVRPDLDFSPVGVISRLGRVRSHVDGELNRVFAAHGLTAPSFGVLVTLARLDDPDGVPQRRLMDELGLTSGTVSVRMDRLAEQGLIERRPDPDDRRNSRIAMTARGRELFERIVPEHLDNERRVLAALSPGEQDLLAALLRKLLVEFEGSVPPGDAPLRLGLTVAPAHATIALRRQVGLPPDAGLLVRAVRDGSPAAAAGIEPGDVLVRAGGHELRAIAGLYGALDDAAPSGRLRVRLLRGTGRRDVTVRLGPAARAHADPGLASTAGRTAPDDHTV